MHYYQGVILNSNKLDFNVKTKLIALASIDVIYFKKIIYIILTFIEIV